MKVLQIALLLAPAFVASQAFAQANPNNPALSNGASVTDEIINLSSGGYYSTALQFDNRYKGVKGSPFLWDAWSPGTLYLSDTVRVATPLMFKMDVYTNEVWTKDAIAQEIILYSHQFRALDLQHLDGSTWKFRKVITPGQPDPHRFYHMLYEGRRFSLYEDLYKTIKRADYQDRGLYTSGSTDDAFVERQKIWLITDKQAAQEISLKKKALLQALPPADADRAAAYCKLHGLKGKVSEAEAVRLLEYLDK
ncbi:MAG TPA: hypothetical protein PK971_16290 [Saprospiraceae bacterium]|nr:hypothetical protein [Saprospiraceae bacterium]